MSLGRFRPDDGARDRVGGSRVSGVAYDVATEVYDGPFDLLLHLILQDEVDIYEVTILRIVDRYIEEIDRMDLLNLEIATEFLLIAATLVELKSRWLLPDENGLDLDDEFALWEERDLLLARLLECKTFKDASAALQVLTRDAARSYPRTAGLEEQFIGLMPDLLDGVDAGDIRDAFKRALTPKPQTTIRTDHITMPVRITVVDACEDILVELPSRGQMTFRALTSPLVDRIEVVVYFLAALELYKQGMLDIQQFTTFGEITLQWIGGESGHDAGSQLAEVDSYDG